MRERGASYLSLVGSGEVLCDGAFMLCEVARLHRKQACVCVCYLSGCDFQLKDMRGISELTQSAFEKLLWRQKRVDRV